MHFSNLFVKNVVQDLTSAGLDWDREKWRGSIASKFIRGGEKNAVKYADEIIVLSKGVQKYFMDEYRNVDIPIIDQGIVQKGQKVSIGDGSYRKRIIREARINHRQHPR